jgi:hypothetical protein
MTSAATAMNVKAGYATPLLQVTDVERSLRFFALLGFTTVDVEGRNAVASRAKSHVHRKRFAHAVTTASTRTRLTRSCS